MIHLRRNGNSHSIGTGRANGNGRGAQVDPQVTVRLLTVRDADALRALAGRDSAPAPNGRVLGAEKHGRLLAAISTSTGHVVADPFHPTADLVYLLRMRAGQLVSPPS
jgi:hypothetical protein